MVIADAIDTYINSTGSVRTELQPALEHLAGNFHSKHLNSLNSWRKAGEWLIDFFQRVPLGAICMMDQQTILYVMHSHPVRRVVLTGLRWGNLLGKGYIDPIVHYCQSLPDFVAHAGKLTLAACQAIRNWASGCAYHLKPDSSLGQLVQKQEKGYALTDTAEPRSHALTSLVNEAPVSRARDLVRLGAWETSSRASVGNDVEINSVIPSPPGRTTENMAASESDEELLLSASQTTSAPTTLLLQGIGAGTSLDDKADPSRVSHSPSPPQALLIPENLFRVIKVYFEDCCRKMVFDDNGILLSPDGAEFRNDLCTNFDSYCFTATMLKEKGSHVEFGRALSKASALVKDILRAEHPRTLACFFEVLIHLIQTGLPEVAFALRGFVKEMSAEVSRKENLWSRICRLLGELDPASLAHAMAQAWRCTTDVLDSVLGTSNRLAVSVRLDYIKRVITDHSEEERLLRDLLAQFGGAPRHPTPRLMLNLAHNLNRQGRHDEAEKVALEVSFVLQNYGIYVGRNAERIESLKVLSRSQFIQGKTLEAERTMREAIRMIVDHWGKRHSWALEFMNVLEGWLRSWGCEKDANTLRGEIEDLMGKDVINE